MMSQSVLQVSRAVRAGATRAVVGVALVALSGCGGDTDTSGGQSKKPEPDASVLESLGSDDNALCATSVVSDEALEKALGASAEEKNGTRGDGVAGSVVYTCDIATDGSPSFVSITAANSSDGEDGPDQSVLDVEMRGQTLGDQKAKYRDVSDLGTVAGFYHKDGDNDSGSGGGFSVIVTVLTINEERMALTFKSEDGKLKEPDALKKLKALGQEYIDGLTAHAA